MRCYLFLMLVVLTTLTGCAESAALIARSSSSERADVFRVQASGDPGAADCVELKISAALKTHVAGAYTEADVHGTAAYQMLVNIDGQAMHLSGTKLEEKKRDLSMEDPEAGVGTKYRFQSEILLKEGTHVMVVALPVDGVVVRKELRLKAGQQNRLVVEPVYGSQTRKVGVTTPLKPNFFAGIKSLRLMLNGEEI